MIVPDVQRLAIFISILHFITSSINPTHAALITTTAAHTSSAELPTPCWFDFMREEYICTPNIKSMKSPPVRTGNGL
jgi:hypothetical protein